MRQLVPALSRSSQLGLDTPLRYLEAHFIDALHTRHQSRLSRKDRCDLKTTHQAVAAMDLVSQIEPDLKSNPLVFSTTTRLPTLILLQNIQRV
ncbi:hypothetical protein F2P81_007727 [Scophthalmus maximus]|uniref:Uncharacterized protein n=1 Tax=Scophthalmus maximus TaxID=52904 RepID=A0A6A4TBC4_SCOMX|nr:hypothetical protein F2P81_007727 [Scophthalmus maximus]